MSRLKSPFFWFILALLTTAGLTAIGPQEKSLGNDIRIVYLHGAWVLTAEAALGLAAAAGLFGILFRRENLQRWSAALGYTGLFFWVTYLPLSLWAMQANWNGLFLAEPRFRVAVIFSVTGCPAPDRPDAAGPPGFHFAFQCALLCRPAHRALTGRLRHAPAALPDL